MKVTRLREVTSPRHNSDETLMINHLSRNISENPCKKIIATLLNFEVSRRMFESE